MSKLICKDCGTSCDRGRRVTRGHLAIEILAWLFFLIPGIMYSIWRHYTRHEVCPSCGSRQLIDMQTPLGKRLALEVGNYEAQVVYRGDNGHAVGLALGATVGKLLRRTRRSTAA